MTGIDCLESGRLRTAKTLKTFLAIAIALTSFSNALAQSISFQILDNNGQAVPNAVISWSEDGSEVATAQSIDYEILDQVDKAFSPKVLVVDAGSVVSFPNSDSIHHHVYSFSPAKTFEIGLYSGEDAAPVQFEKPGVVVLGCNIHDVMLGYIYVNDSLHHAKSDAQGFVSIDSPLPANALLKVWHVNLAADENTVSVEVAEIQENDNRLQIPVMPAPEVRAVSTPLEQRFESLRKARNGS